MLPIWLFTPQNRQHTRGFELHLVITKDGKHEMRRVYIHRSTPLTFWALVLVEQGELSLHHALRNLFRHGKEKAVLVPGIIAEAVISGGDAAENNEGVAVSAGGPGG